MTVLQSNIKKLRISSGMTQNVLSEILGVSFQTVSKWENGNSMPDITLLPDISSIFKVSVDQLLGIIPIDYETYTHRIKNSSEYRDGNMEQFLSSRQLFWNDDYLEFIISKVWHIDTPIKIAEINCGNGVFSHQLLNHLPKGSVYSGYEKSDFMRSKGEELHQSRDDITLYPFEAIDKINNEFDIVICQGYLRHHNKPLMGIEMMKNLTKPGGLIVCHEENRPFENAGLLLGNEVDASFEKGVFLDKMWQKELDQEGRDYRIGLRLPLLLESTGLINIQCRMNDHVDLLLGDETSKSKLDLLNAHYKITSIDENNFLNFLMERGLSRYEAFRYIDLYEQRKSFMSQDYKQIKMIHCMGLMLSWGTKPLQS